MTHSAKPIKTIPDPFELALKGPKYARTTVEEFEKESEELQAELFLLVSS